MTMLVFFYVLNTIFRVGIMMICVLKLTVYRPNYNCAERVGLGIGGGSALLTIPGIWYGHETPFVGWSTALFSFGILVYLLGRISRHYKGSLWGMLFPALPPPPPDNGP